MVVAMIALAVALAGTAYAAIKVTGKNVKDKTLTGKDVKPDSLTDKQIKESTLGQVPAAERAAVADTIGGIAPAQLVTDSRFVYRFATAGFGQSTTVAARGPYTVKLDCLLAGNDSNGPLYDAELLMSASEPSRYTATAAEAGAGGNDTPAGTVITLGKTTPVNQGLSAYKSVAGYLDVSGGRTMDVSARLRVGRLGTPGCSAATNVVFNGF